MTRFEGSSSAQIAVPLAECFALVCDYPRTPEWHKVVQAVEVLDRDEAGRARLVSTKLDAMVAQVQVRLLFTYEGERALHMRRVSGDLKDLSVSWTFEELGSGGTLAHFRTEFDPGRLLSLLARGPVIERLQELLALQPPEGLKQALEAPGVPQR
jgi:ribosome-associated toxin RatA of RatAB toxin-antitoxin module